MKEEDRCFWEMVCLSCLLFLSAIAIALGIMEAWQITFG